ncbi:MAG: DUF11 domain-containing protein [Acidobacteriia bacterium]|nr:DUF11 domain-containing protein [Terriglobia bacterium]
MSASLFVPCVAALFLVLSPAAHAQILISRDEVRHDASPPLRDLAAAAQRAQAAKPFEPAPEEAQPVRTIPLPDGFKPLTDPDMVLQQTASAAPGNLAPAAIQNFDGIGQGVAGFTVQGAPPDTNGAVGLTQYLQWVNVSLAVYDKATTSLLLGPVAGKTLWTGFGGPCETNNDGDAIALYDKLADRWVLSQFAVRGNGPGGFGPAFLQCVAVSQTSDATGAYNRYAFSYSAFDDYPKMGVWPDAYYVTFNMFTPPSLFFSGANACAYDRNAMLNGLAATQVCFQQGSSVLGLLPSDMDGLNAPPAGEPNFLMHFSANALNLYKFHVDFATPANSTLTGPTIIPVSPFTPLCGGGRNCVPQSGDATALDSLADRLMYRLAYRNFGDHESLVVNHSVAANATSGGVRWYEIQNPSGTPIVAQQSTFAPDANFRWMGSIAMDHDGNMALGYSVSSATMFPSIAFTGRLSTDPAGTMQAESSMIAGGGAQNLGLTRWGDYSAMQIDPADDCTFWYTNEYLKLTGNFNWNTRIASFKYPGCNFPDLKIAKTHAGKFTQGQTGATFTLTVTNVGHKATDGTAVTVTDALPAKLTATAAAGTGWTCVLVPAISCTRSDVLASNASYPPITLTVTVAADAPGLLTNSATVGGGGDSNPGNNQASDTVTIIQTGPDLTITKTHTPPFIQTQPGVYTLTVSNVGLSPTNGTLVTVTDPVPTGLTVTSAAGTGWTCSPAAANPVSCTRTDVLAAAGSYPPIALTVTPSVAPAVVSNTATVSGGGDTNPLNNSATDPTAIIVPPPDLSITKTHTGNFNQGQAAASYTLTVSNSGLGASAGTVTVKENIPAGLTGNSFFGSGWFCDSVAMVCTRADSLPVGSSYPPITLFVSVDGNAPATIVNSATVSGGTDITPGNNTATDPTTIVPAPDLTLAVSHAPDPFVQGQEGAYTIAVSNQGNAATAGVVTVTENLPFGMTATDLVAPGWNCVGSNFMTCSRSDALAPGASYPAITLTVFVSGASSQSVNQVSVSGGGEFNLRNDSVFDITGVIAPRLSIAATSSASTFTLGQTGTYTITVKNTGSGPTSGLVTMQESLPRGFTAIGILAPGWTCSTPPVTPIVTCTRADPLAAGASYPSIVVAFSVLGGDQSAFSNFQVSGGGDPNFNSTFNTVNVVSPVLSLGVSSGNFVLGQGGYQILVGNTGTVSTLGTVTVTASLNTGLTATGFTGTGWSCNPFPAQVVSCTRSDVLGPKQNFPLVTIAVTAGISGSVNNFVSVTGGGDLSQHPAFVSDFINPFIIFSMVKSHAGDFTAGQSGVYTIAISNTGSLPSSGLVTMNDSMPAGLLATAVTAPGWNCLLLPTLVNCTRSDSLAPGASYPPITITVSVAGNGPVITNQASITGGGDLQFHFAADPTNIIAPQLGITKSHVGDFTVGQPASYTLNVSNTGLIATAGTVTVSDPLPAGMSLTGFTGDGWTCSGSQIVTCTRSDSLAAGASYPSLTLNVSVGDAGPGGVNTASVTGGGDFFFHFASDPTVVIAPVLSIGKSHVPEPLVVGQTGTYTISISNVGTMSTSGTLTMTDNLPARLTATGASGAGWTCSGTTTVTCTRSDVLAPNSAWPAISVPVNVTSGLFNIGNVATVSGGGVQFAQSNFDSANITVPQLALALSHNGNFTVGQPGTLTATVSNVGTIPSLGVVHMNDLLPGGVTATAAGGAGWTCAGSTFISCSRSDALAPGSSYPAISMTVSVSGSVQNVSNLATLDGGGNGQTQIAFDTIFVNTSSLAIAKSHTGTFAAGQAATYTITVSNPGPVASAGLVTVNDVLPPGLTATAINSPASGWSCSTPPVAVVSCSRSDVLAPGASYPSIVMTVAVDATVPGAVVNQAVLSGGGDLSSHTAFDLASVSLPDLAITATHPGDFAAGQPGTYTLTVSNVGTTPTPAAGTVVVEDFVPQVMTPAAVSGTGWTCATLAGPPQQVNCTRPGEVLAQGASYPPITLNVNVAPDAPISTVTNVADVVGGSDANPGNDTALDDTHIAGFRFVPVTPCRIADTRNATGPFGGPFIGGNTTREINIPGSGCNIPATAQAYSLNITVVPKGPLGFLTMFPCGQTRPLASTLNSLDGRIKAEAAILPAGTNGSVCAFPTNDTDLVMDIDGYFVPATVPAGLAFYPVTPCRLMDTRLANGPLGGPSLAGSAARGFPILTSPCAVPPAAKAYSLNYTVVPKGPLGFLTTWPAGSPQPLVSTLNALTGAVTANAAIVPAGANGDISVFVTNSTDLVIDIDGYFAPPGPGGLALQNVTPCRVLDTRNANGVPFNGQVGIGVTGSPCGIPTTAQSFVLNATVVPPGPLGFLTLWPNGAPQPLVSTLNAGDGAITSNMAIVPSTNGFISAFASNATHLVLDISGYFVP